jgi:hypothetical protein
MAASSSSVMSMARLNWVVSVVLKVCPTDSRAVRRCALGALIAAAYQLTNDHSQAHEIAISAVRPLFGTATLVNINDVRGHAAVLALFDEVVATNVR